MRVLIILFALLLSSVLQAAPATTDIDSSNWQFQQHSFGVLYYVPGKVVHGHQFGFVKLAGKCHANVLWVSLSSYDPTVTNYKNALAEIQIRVEDGELSLPVRVVSVSPFTELMQVAIFNGNAMTREQVVSLGGLGKITVEVSEPAALGKRLDTGAEEFTLDDTEKAEAKALSMCAGLE